MTTLSSFDLIYSRARDCAASQTMTLGVVCAHDEVLIDCCRAALDLGLIRRAVLIGDAGRIEPLLGGSGAAGAWQVVPAAGEREAVAVALDLAAAGQIDFAMKGLLQTADFLKPFLTQGKEYLAGGVVSSVVVTEIKSYHKLLLLTDAALNIAPDLGVKVEMIANAVQVARALGIALPKVAALAPAETVSPKMESTLEAALLAKMADRKQIAGCLVDGPLALDNAISAYAAEHKGIASPVAGDADILLAPNLDAAAMLYKAITCLVDCRVAGILAGCSLPLIMTSRADTSETKLNSIALAIVYADFLRRQRSGG